jgi:hypothetical protein
MNVGTANELVASTSCRVSGRVLKELKILAIIVTQKSHGASTTHNACSIDWNRLVILCK